MFPSNDQELLYELFLYSEMKENKYIQKQF